MRGRSRISVIVQGPFTANVDHDPSCAWSKGECRFTKIGFNARGGDLVRTNQGACGAKQRALSFNRTGPGMTAR